MDMKAFRADLQQKSFNARKTNNYEDRINVTYKGMVSETSEEHYKVLSENLEKSVNFLTGVLRAAEYRAANAVMQNALRGRSNNLNEDYTPAVFPPFTPGQGYVPPPPPPPPPPAEAPAQQPGNGQETRPSGPRDPNLPPKNDPNDPFPPGFKYRAPDGTTYTWGRDTSGQYSWHRTSNPPVQRAPIERERNHPHNGQGQNPPTR